jgi:hypothetical protein
MNPSDHDKARERLLDQVFDARSLVEIAAAKEALRVWLQTYAEEPGMADAFEVLSHQEDFARMQEAERVTPEVAATK